MLSVTLTRHSVTTLTAAPAVPALERSTSDADALKNIAMKMFVPAFLLCVAATTTIAVASEPSLKLEVIAPTKPIANGDDITLEVIVSTDGEQSHTFLLGSFAQSFGIYVLGPWGAVQPDLTKVRPENWMNQEHSAAASITVAKDKPYRTKVKLSDYFKVGDPDAFKPGRYQLNVKFYESGWQMSAPIDSGAVLFELAPRK